MRVPLSTCVDFVRSKLEENPSFIPAPDWTHHDVITKGTKVISFDQIYIDDYTRNSSTKVEAHTGNEIEILKNSFAEGVHLSEYPPAVKYRGDNYEKPYELVYGFGRSESLFANQQTEWYFTVLEGTEDALEDVRAEENEQLPKTINKEIDMKHFLTKKIKEGKIKNDEASIRAKFKKVYPNRDKTVMNRVVQQVMEDVNTPQPYYIYTSPARVQQWLDNHSSEEYIIGGDEDKDRDMYGAVVKEGYQYRAIIAAMRRYVDEGKYTYFIGHCATPTSKATLSKKRKQFLKELNDIKYVMEKCGLTTFPIEVMGFLPQFKEKENWKVLVKPEEVL